MTTGAHPRVDHLLVLVGGSVLPLYLAIVELCPTTVELLVTERTKSDASHLSSCLAVNRPGLSVNLSDHVLAPGDYRHSRRAVACALRRVPDAFLLIAGGTKAMAVAAADARACVKGAGNASEPLYIAVQGADTFFVHDGSATTWTYAPCLDELVTVQGYQITNAPASRPARHAGVLRCYDDPEFALKQTSQARGRTGRRLYRAYLLRSHATFIDRIQHGTTNRLTPVVRQAAMRMAYLAAELGGEYARGAVLVDGCRKDAKVRDAVSSLHNNVAIGWAGPGIPRAFINDKQGVVEMEAWARRQ